MMRGYYQTPQAANNAQVSLYNNSADGALLAVWALSANSTNGSFLISGVANSKFGTSVGAISPMVTGYPVLAGEIDYLDTATIITPDWQTSDGTDFQMGVVATIPRAILARGWSYSIQDPVGAKILYIGFIWQVIHRADLLGKFCPICDEPD